jgi:hypothetical protein
MLMKTAATIEAQEERKKVEKNSRAGSANSAPGSAKYDHRQDAERLKPYQFKPGQSGNPSGRPAHDVASEIAQALFTNNPDVIYEAFLRVLKKGSPYAYQVLSDRAFGKLKETRTIEHAPYQDVSTPDLEAHVQELEAKLVASLVERGYIITKPPQLLPPPIDETKSN